MNDIEHEINSEGEFWYLNGDLHRTDGPAVIHPDGSKEWWLNNMLHREDGPALEYFSSKGWWVRDGAEVEWWLHGIKLTPKHAINNSELKDSIRNS